MLPSRRIRTYTPPPPRIILTVNENRAPIDSQTLDDIKRQFEAAWKQQRTPILLDGITPHIIPTTPARRNR